MATKREKKTNIEILEELNRNKIEPKRTETKSERAYATQALTQMTNKQKTMKELVGDKFRELLPQYIEERSKEFEKELNDFKIQNEVLIETSKGKINTYKLSRILSKPLFINGIAISKLSAYDMMTFSQCYWDCVGLVADTVIYVPTIEQLCSFMSLSTSSFFAYKQSQDPEVREVVQIIFDKFVDYYTVKGMTNELNSIMAMFTMKARYGLRDNDTPQTVVNNYNASVPQSSIDELEKRFGISDDVVDVGEV